MKARVSNFVFTTQGEFTYNYDTNQLFLIGDTDKYYPLFSKMVDKPEPKIKIFRVYRNLKSHNEAQRHLDEIVVELKKKELIKQRT